jgi:integrase
MSPAWIRVRQLAITKRNPKGGKSYQVLYRRGGRAFRIKTAGSFRTKREATIRCDLVAGWLAGGLDPAIELAKITDGTPRVETLARWARRYEISRVDLSAETARSIVAPILRIEASAVADTPITEITVADVQEIVAAWSAELKPSSVRRYMGTLRLIFDFAGVDPNPARDRHMRLPANPRTEANPPTADQFIALLNAMPRRYWLPLVVLEQTGMRVGEAASLAWGDVDEQGSRFRLRSANVKIRRARWVQVPGWLMEIVAESLPREDRTEERRVFQNFSADVAKNAMARACRTAGLPHFHPHDLRHRRGTIWHHDPAITIREQMDRGGWTRSDVAIETYSHLMALEEVPVATLRGLLVMSP